MPPSLSPVSTSPSLSQVVLLFASPIMLLEEVLKYIGRNRAHLKEAAFAKFKEAQAHAQAHAPHPPTFPPPMF